MEKQLDNAVAENHGSVESLASRVLEIAKHGEASDLMEIWPEVIASPPAESSFYTQIMRSRATTYDPVAMQVMLEELAAKLVKDESWQTILRLGEAAATIYPDSEPIKAATIKALYAKYESHPNIVEMMATTQLEQDAPLDQGLKRFRGLLKLSPGRAYQHATWGVGVIQNLDLESGKVTLDFPADKGRVLTLAGVRDFLSYLPPSHFLSKRATEPEKLTQLAEEDPAALVRAVLESHGGKIKQSDLKAQILNHVIPETKWASWWTRARAALKLDPLIDFGTKGGAHAEIVLRSQPKTFEEEVQDLFFAPDSQIAERAAAVKKLQEPGAGKQPPPEMVSRMLKGLSDDYGRNGSDMSLSERLQTALLAEDLVALGASSAGSSLPQTSQVIQQFQSDYSPVLEIESQDLAARALRILLEKDGENGPEFAAALLPRASSKLAQVIWKSLNPENHKDLAVHAVQELLERPIENPQTYLWAIKQLAEGGWPHLEEFFPAPRIVEDLLNHLDTWDRMLDHPSVDKATQTTAKLLLSRVKSQLENKHFAYLVAAAEQMDLDRARRLRRQLQGHHALSDSYRSSAERQVVLTRRELLEEQAAPPVAGQAPTENPTEGLHYCTAKAREEKFRELDELNTVKIPNNTREIEKARSEGDLKENAGYIYAKEQQKLLMQASLQLQQFLQTARIFDKAKVNTSIIGFGTSFEAMNLKQNRTEKYTVLGKFETDPDANIISYQSPFLQQFIGLSEGAEVTIKHPDGGSTPYRILSITNALSGTEWDAPEFDQ